MESERDMKTDLAPSTPSLSKEDWRKHCHGWSKSGLSKTEYCRRHDLSKDNFYYWCKKILPTNKGAASENRLRSNFVPVVSKSASEQRSTVNHLVMLELRYPNDLKVNLELSESTMVTLLKELGNAAAIIR